MNKFDRFYNKDVLSFGEKPSPELIRIVNSNHLNCKALDIGAGDGRNSLYLALNGFSVTAVDYSHVGLKKLNKLAFEKKLSNKISTVCADVRKMNYPVDEYDLVVAVTLFDHLPARDVQPLWDKIVRSIKANGSIFVRVHTTEDPGYLKQKERASELSKMIKHYFKPNELRILLDNNFAIDEYEESLSEDDSHGPRHFHGFATAIAHRVT
jgi:cyclopropane fatty-acyl-phospholipid synthase-like methyltransferase